MHSRYLLPGAVVLGSGIIGLGLYAGLRARPVPAPPPTVSSEPVGGSVIVQASVPPASGRAPPSISTGAPAASSIGQSTVESEAEQALLAEKKKTFVPRCWTPTTEKQPDPPRSTYLFSLSFDAAGHEVARGISEVRGHSRTDVAACLRTLPIGLEIPPPSVPITVAVRLELP